MSLMLTRYRPGYIGMGSSSRGSYRMFDVCLGALDKPHGTSVNWKMSVNLAWNFNEMCREMLKEGADWLFILGDDHVFHPDILKRLLSRNVDIVAPLCLRRGEPYTPVIHEHDDETNKHKRLDWDFINGKTGIIEVPACGNAGMLIRRNVIEKMNGTYWHAVGQYNMEIGAPDLYFCGNARHHGFKIHVDLDNVIGHISEFAVWPHRNTDGNYEAKHYDATVLQPKQGKV